MPKIQTTHPLGRGDGTDLPVNGRLYEFRFVDGVCVAEVDNELDYQTILGISAGYQPYGPGFPTPEELEAAALAEVAARDKAEKDAAILKAHAEAEAAKANASTTVVTDATNATKETK